MSRRTNSRTNFAVLVETRRTRRAAIVIAAALIVGACSGSDDAEPVADTDSTTSNPAAAAETTAPPSDGASDPMEAPGSDDAEPVADDESQAAPTSPSTTAPPMSDEFGRTTGRFNYDGPAAFAATATPSEVSMRPLISWEPVPAAATYEVVVTVADGERYWIWDGTDTEVPIGGSPLLGERSAGAQLTPGLLWWVLARDADGLVIAQTEILEVPG